MSLLVGFAQACCTDVRVDLRRHKTLVAKQLLNAADVSPAIEQVGREAMPQGVRRSSCVETGLFEMLFEHATDASSR